MRHHRLFSAVFILSVLTFVASGPLGAQSINSGTVTDTVTDPSGAVVAKALVRSRNAVTGYEQSVTADL